MSNGGHVGASPPSPESVFGQDRPLPAVPANVLSVTRHWAYREPFVYAKAYADPDGDRAVFAAVYSVHLYNGGRWLVRALLRRGDGGMAPILSRVAVEHLPDAEADPRDEPIREVTGLVMRDIPFGRIRDRALELLPRRASALELLAESGVPVPLADLTAARASADAAALLPGGSEHLRYLAERYRSLVGAGQRHVLKALLDEESQRLGTPVPRHRMRGWLRRATEAELLPPGRPGTARFVQRSKEADNDDE